MQTHKLSVRLFGQPVGVLEADNKGKLHFNYLDNAAMSISLWMPVSEKVFDHKHCHRFFRSLLPQNDNIINSLSKALGIEPNNTFEFLHLMGHDCIGALSFHLPYEPIEDKQTSLLQGDLISDKKLLGCFDTLYETPILMNEEGRRSLLPGLHSKVAVCVVDNQVAVPAKGCFSTHILKLPIKHDNASIENEYFCMRLASKMGLPVCSVEMRTLQKTSYLLIERYDRQVHDNVIMHYHQEDFCQALGILASRKFQIHGGVGLSHCFALLQRANIPAIDRNHFMRMVFFNYLIKNTQAHGKNISLLYLSPKHFQLAPFYDISSNIEEGANLAMSVGETFLIEAIEAKNWELLCTVSGYSYVAFKQFVEEILDTILENAKSERTLMKAQEKSVCWVDEFIKALIKNVQHARKMFDLH